MGLDAIQKNSLQKQLNQQQPQKNPQEKQDTQEKQLPLQNRIDQIVGLLPSAARDLVVDLLQLINNQGQAITTLQNQVLTLAETIKANSQGLGVGTVDNSSPEDVNAPSRTIPLPDNGNNATQSRQEVQQKSDLEQLVYIMEMIKSGGSMFGGKAQVSTEMIEGLVAQRDAINKLIPPNPYEELATKLGIKVLENFATTVGKSGSV